MCKENCNINRDKIHKRFGNILQELLDKALKEDDKRSELYYLAMAIFLSNSERIVENLEDIEKRLDSIEETLKNDLECIVGSLVEVREAIEEKD